MDRGFLEGSGAAQGRRGSRRYSFFFGFLLAFLAMGLGLAAFVFLVVWPCWADSWFINFGNRGDIGVVGDWDGDGVQTIGVYRPTTGFFYLRNSRTPGVADISVPCGSWGTNKSPVVLHGGGASVVGTYDSSAALFELCAGPVVNGRCISVGPPSGFAPIVKLNPDTALWNRIDGDANTRACWYWDVPGSVRGFTFRVNPTGDLIGNVVREFILLPDGEVRVGVAPFSCAEGARVHFCFEVGPFGGPGQAVGQVDHW